MPSEVKPTILTFSMRSRWKLVRKPSTSNLISPVSPINSTYGCKLSLFLDYLVLPHWGTVALYSRPAIWTKAMQIMICVGKFGDLPPIPSSDTELQSRGWSCMSCKHVHQVPVFYINYHHLHAGKVVESFWQNLHSVIDESIGGVQWVFATF